MAPGTNARLYNSDIPPENAPSFTSHGVNGIHPSLIAPHPNVPRAMAPMGPQTCSIPETDNCAIPLSSEQFSNLLEKLSTEQINILAQALLNDPFPGDEVAPLSLAPYPSVPASEAGYMAAMGPQDFTNFDALQRSGANYFTPSLGHDSYGLSPSLPSDPSTPANQPGSLAPMAWGQNARDDFLFPAQPPIDHSPRASAYYLVERPIASLPSRVSQPPSRANGSTRIVQSGPSYLPSHQDTLPSRNTAEVGHPARTAGAKGKKRAGEALESNDQTPQQSTRKKPLRLGEDIVDKYVNRLPNDILQCGEEGCGKLYERKDLWNLRNHLRTKHGHDPKPLFCKVCNADYKNPNELAKHMWKKHNGPAPKQRKTKQKASTKREKCKYFEQCKTDFACLESQPYIDHLKKKHNVIQVLEAPCKREMVPASHGQHDPVPGPSSQSYDRIS
ncbi:hypothetical protein PTTG_12680 [Puccinia triticina 1-1 BBBD Race 1]|uniref:C2H2-type domain-containing protein n=1 Tax=Puccinia triticina (isolate 1-1 / race 1 (BBBD)) TaxID=630390 RepID=A0A180G0W2_PUCT1|nr:hypothetical protein PTTG_12680 [Puccinia triticina 1-1 BBBD Race 1]